MNTNRRQLETLMADTEADKLGRFDPVICIDGERSTFPAKKALEILQGMSDEDLDAEWPSSRRARKTIKPADVGTVDASELAGGGAEADPAKKGSS